MNSGTKARVMAIAMLAFSMSACATVERGSNDEWRVITDPSGARVETSNGHFCAATPCEIRMARRSTFIATVTLPGYKTETYVVKNRLSGEGAMNAAGNVLIGGIIGLGVDAFSGAALDLDPNPLHLILERDETAGPPK